MGCFLLGLGDDALSVANDALGLLDLAGDRQPELLDQLGKFVLFHHHPMAEGHPLADADHFLELIQKVEELDRSLAGAMLRFWLSVFVVAHGATGRPAATAPNRSRSTRATF